MTPSPNFFLDQRRAGILAPLASLPNRHGIGDFGPETISFLKLIEKAGFSLWQVLPLNPIGYGHSPYQPFSSLAMDEMYISLDSLRADGLIDEVKGYHANRVRIAYEKVCAHKEKYVRKAFKEAVRRNPNLRDLLHKEMAEYYSYAVFMAFKTTEGNKPWSEWEEAKRSWADNRHLDLVSYQDEIDYRLFAQSLLRKQWRRVRDEAHRMGIQIIGDLPFYVGYDSVDCYMNQRFFLLDESGLPKKVAGVGPDYFSKSGQRWGNPIYDFRALKNDNYSFLINRIADCGDIYDIVRLDHFRAFDTYYEIDAASATAEHGRWRLGPGRDFFDALFKRLMDIKIIAEDLGELRSEVLSLREHYHLPGMKVLQFTFIDEEINKKSPLSRTDLVSYIGTHDNDTLRGWYGQLAPTIKKQIRRALSKKGFRDRDVCERLIAYALNEKSAFVILSLADLLKLGSAARINTPGIIDDKNWTFRVQSLSDLESRVHAVHALLDGSGRICKK